MSRPGEIVVEIYEESIAATNTKQICLTSKHAAKFVRLESTTSSHLVSLQEGNPVRFSAEVRDKLLNKLVRADHSSQVRISKGPISTNFRVFVGWYSLSEDSDTSDQPEYLQVTELTQVIIDRLCVGYRFSSPLQLSSVSNVRSDPCLDPLAEAALSELISAKKIDRSLYSSLLLASPTIDSSFSVRIKSLSCALGVPLLHIQAGLLLLESVRASSSLAVAFKRTLKCCAVMTPCVVLIEDLHALCPPPGSERFNTDPQTYSDTARTLTQFIQFCNNKNPSLSANVSSSSIKVIGLCQCSETVSTTPVSLIKSVALAFHKTVQLPYPDTMTRRKIVNDTVANHTGTSEGIDKTRALNSWADKLVGMTATSIFEHTRMQLKLARANSDSISSHITAENLSNISSILGGVSELFDIKLRPVIDPLFASAISLQPQDTESSKRVNASVKAVITTTTSFGRIRGQEMAKREITEAVLWPRWFPHIFKAYRAHPATGVLLYGPPGTGKSLFPSVLASELGCHLVNIRLSDVVKGSIGSGERALRESFTEAKKTAPSIIFIDEFQAIFTSRGAHDGVGSSLAFALNTCFDDICAWNENAGSESLVTVFAATNEPWAIDSGFLRPGRLERIVFVGPLDLAGRLEFFSEWFTSKVEKDGMHAETLTEQKKLVEWLAESTDGFTGADCALLMRKACLSCYSEYMDIAKTTGVNKDQIGSKLLPCHRHFQEVLLKMQGSVSSDDVRVYTQWKEHIKISSY